MSMLNKWNYTGMGDVCYGEEVAYQKCAAFLGADLLVEDWGCGMGWAKKYFKNYVGLDGSASIAVPVVTDLETYTSNVPNILLKEVLEHNWNWQKVLANAMQSFTNKLCVTVHTPFVAMTKTIAVTFNDATVSSSAIDMLNKSGVPSISFNINDILAYFKGCTVTQETISTNFEYGTETLFYVTKNPTV